MKNDFDNRRSINQPTFSEIIFGWLCRCRQYKKFVKIYKRGISKVDEELDIIKILKQ